MMFLTPEEIQQLTGVQRGCKGKTRFQRQIEVLRKMKIPHFINIAGRPVVARAMIEGGVSAEKPKYEAWEPA